MQLYGIQTQRIYINVKKMNEVENKKNRIYNKMCKKKNVQDKYTVDLINNIRRNVQEDVQTGCTGYLHSSNTNGRNIINNLLIISDY